MRSTIYFVLSLVTSFAADVSVFSSDDYYTVSKPELLFESTYPWKFGFNSGDRLSMAIIFRSSSTNVLSDVTCCSGTETVTVPKLTIPGKDTHFFVGNCTLSGPEAVVSVKLCKSNSSCASKIVAKGMNLSTAREKNAAKEYIYNDICLNTPTRSCVFALDLKDLFELEKHAQQTSRNVFLYVIPFVIVICVIILVIYIGIKKYCPRNSNPTLELSTYVTASEVLYADLGFVHGDSQPPKQDEESPYAQIIGVLKPDDGKLNNK